MSENQYDTLLRAAEPGLIITINNSLENQPGTQEFTITSSDADKTNVTLETTFGDQYRITRMKDNDLMLEETTNGHRHCQQIQTIEILGTK